METPGTTECRRPGGATGTRRVTGGVEPRTATAAGETRVLPDQAERPPAYRGASGPQAGDRAPPAAGIPKLETAPGAAACAAYAIRPQRRGTGHATT